jgi:PAS domain S-box-containing protein
MSQNSIDQENAERTLRLRARILDQIADAVIAVDNDERVTYLNRVAAELFGVEGEDAVGRGLSDLEGWEWPDGEDGQAARPALRAHGRWRGEGMHVTEDGKRVRLESTISVLQDDDGRAAGLVAVMRDVTGQWEAGAERQRLREDLQRHVEQLEAVLAERTTALWSSEARFLTIFEDAVMGIALLDGEGRIVASNPALRGMVGYGEEELAHTALRDYLHADDAKAEEDLYRTLASGELGYYQIERRYVRKDGHVRWGELTVSRVKRTNGDRPWLAIVAIEDTTEKRRSRQTLLEAERWAIAGRLGSMLAHEINNPLQSVIGCLALAEEALEEGGGAELYIDVAMEQLERAAGIVNQLRDLNRERRPETHKPTDVNRLVARVLTLTRKQCRDRGVRVEWTPASDLPSVRMAAGRVQRALLTVVLNAVEAMPEGGRLRVRTAATQEVAGALVTFSDTRPGRVAATRSPIAEALGSSKFDSLDLGLQISKNIVEEHGGRIEVESRAGEGATFAVWLPA